MVLGWGPGRENEYLGGSQLMCQLLDLLLLLPQQFLDGGQRRLHLGHWGRE